MFPKKLVLEYGAVGLGCVVPGFSVVRGTCKTRPRSEVGRCRDTASFRGRALQG